MKRSLNIGLNYAGTNFKLGGCENDAFEMRKRMRDAAPGYSVDQFWMETGNYSAADLFRHLEHFRATNTRTDTVYITFSGHGTELPAIKPGQMDQGICLFHKGGIEVVRDADFAAALEQIPGTVVVILDSCFSGGMSRETAQPGMSRKFLPFDPASMTVHERPAAERSSRPPRDNKTYFLFACGEKEVSYDLGHIGFFTQALCAYYDRLPPKSRTITTLMTVARKTCQPYQSPMYDCNGGSGAKRIF